MKKLLILLTLAICLIPVGAWGVTTWYACAGTKNIDSGADSEGTTTSDVWRADAACTGAWRTWTTASGFTDGLVAGDILNANGQVAIAVNVDPGAAGKKVVLQATTGGAAAFTAATATISAIHADIKGGSAANTYGLSITGSTAGTPVLTITGDIDGGTSTTSSYGIGIGHTVGTVSIVGGILGKAAPGVLHSSAGPVTITGNVSGSTTAAAGWGYYSNSTGSVTINGNATASLAVAFYQGSTGITTLVGNLMDSVTNPANGGGRLIWNPRHTDTTWDYHRVVVDATPTYAYITIAPAASDVKLATNFGATNGDAYDTGELAVSGGGAWGF